MSPVCCCFLATLACDADGAAGLPNVLQALEQQQVDLAARQLPRRSGPSQLVRGHCRRGRRCLALSLHDAATGSDAVAAVLVQEVEQQLVENAARRRVWTLRSAELFVGCVLGLGGCRFRLTALVPVLRLRGLRVHCIV